VRLAAALLVLLAPVPTAPAQAPAAESRAASAERRILVMLDLPPEHYRPGGDYGAGGYGDAAAAQARHRLAARLAREQGLTLLDTWPMPLLGVDCVIMAVPGSEPLDRVAARLARRSGVAWSQPMNEFTAQAARTGQPNDRLFAAQPAARAWQLAALHRLATGAGVSVAVIDSQIDARHPDLAGRVAMVRDFVGAPPMSAEAHGTGVAGIIAAEANNGLGIVGVAPEARLMGLRACWQRAPGETVCDSISLARALLFATERRAGVINMSLSGPSDPLIARLVAVAQRRGAVVVAAVDPRTGTGFPASLPGVVRVARGGVASARAGVYNAPGRDVPTTEPGGRWDLVSGNSYAAAHVSGLLALTRQLRRADGDLVAARADGGEIDACATVRRAAGSSARGC
jgi:subtilisin family serine protease